VTRKGRFALLIGGTAGLLLLFGFVATKPKFWIATQAEVDAQIDPVLLQWQEPSPEMIDRARRLDAAMAAMKLGSGGSGTAADQQQAITDYLKHSEDRKGIVRIVAEGPIGRTWSMRDSNFIEFRSHKNIAKMYGLAARGFADKGNGTRALESLREGFAVFDATRKAENSIISYLVDVAIEAILVHACYAVSKTNLTNREREELLALIPKAEQIDHDLVLSLKGEFHYGPRNWLPNPKERLKGTGGMNAWMLLDLESVEPPKDEWYGTYDPLETAKTASDQFMEQLHNAGSPAGRQESAIEKALEIDSARLPEAPDEPQGRSFAGAAKWALYKVRMNITPNSYGRIAISTSAMALMSTSWKSRTTRELVRAAIAARIFKDRERRPVKGVKELVEAGIIARMPHDFFADAPLRYGTSPERIWSVGTNKVDDGGKYFRTLDSQSPDYCATVP
jgi:hypothetical protein